MLMIYCKQKETINDMGETYSHNSPEESIPDPAESAGLTPEAAVRVQELTQRHNDLNAEWKSLSAKHSEALASDARNAEMDNGQEVQSKIKAIADRQGIVLKELLAIEQDITNIYGQ